jgi:hypothetical protein
MQRHFLTGMLTALVNNYATQLIAKPNVFCGSNGFRLGCTNGTLGFALTHEACPS